MTEAASSRRRRHLALACAAGLAIGAYVETMVTAVGADAPTRAVTGVAGILRPTDVSPLDPRPPSSMVPSSMVPSSMVPSSMVKVETVGASDATASPFDLASRTDGEALARTLLFAAAAMALLALTLLESLLFAVFQGIRSSEPVLRPAPARAAPSRALTEAEHEARCQQLFQAITTLWARAETAVQTLDEALPLRALLMKELKQIQQRLAMDPAMHRGMAGALTVRHEASYWKSLGQRLNQSARDLNRIGAVAEAAGAGFGSAGGEPRIPTTRDEACFILGANREADTETLQRLVKALRQCWHPDLAQNDADRRHREARIKQINAAHDLITGKRGEG